MKSTEKVLGESRVGFRISREASKKEIINLGLEKVLFL